MTAVAKAETITTTVKVEVEEEALESWIDFKSSEESAYDGPELHTYVSDETSKTKKDVSIIERQNVTRFCTEIGGEFKGFHYYTTTVEIEEGEDQPYAQPQVCLMVWNHDGWKDYDQRDLSDGVYGWEERDLRQGVHQGSGR